MTLATGTLAKISKSGIFLSELPSSPTGTQQTVALRHEMAESSQNKVPVPHSRSCRQYLSWAGTQAAQPAQHIHQLEPKTFSPCPGRPPCLPEAVHTPPFLSSSDVAEPACLSPSPQPRPDRTYTAWSGSWGGRGTCLECQCMPFPYTCVI